MISFDEFKKVELRVGMIRTAERVEKSEKLLKLTVDVGEASPRQIIAGVGKNHQPEALIGQQVVVVVNLEPRMIMDLESQGMVLAADGVEGPIVLEPEKEVSTGAIIK